MSVSDASHDNLQKWPYQVIFGGHALSFESINSIESVSSDSEEECIYQLISHLETKTGQRMQTHGNNRCSFLTKLLMKENERKRKHEDARVYIKSLFDNTVTLLQETYSVFRKSEVHLGDSIGEQTKFCRPDEFDFVIILPQLAEIDIFYPYRMNENKHIREYAKDFNFGYPNAFKGDIRLEIHDLLLASLVENLNDGWKIMLTGCNFFTRKTAVTFHLIRNADGFEVDIDVSILIPFEKVTLSSHADDLNIKQYYIDKLANDKGVIYAIFRYKNHAFRPSKAHLEEVLLKKESRQRVYTVAKLIVKYFLPTMEFREHCRRCKESIVGSYTLKNILLYMIHAYPNDWCWSDNHFSTRVIEVFVILKHCYEQTMCNFVEYVSMKMTHLENKFRYSPSLKLLIPKDVKVTRDIRHDDKWIEIDKEFEGSTFRELSEIHFQMNAKRFGANADINTRTGLKHKVRFYYDHHEGEIDFDPFKSTPGKRKIDPKRPQIIHIYATSPLSCFLPCKEDTYDTISDAFFQREVDKYFCFLRDESWDFKDVITRLVQLLLCENKACCLIL